MMLRRAIAVGILTAAPVLSAQAQTIVLDQSVAPHPAPIPFTIAVGGPREQVVSQTVTVGVTGRLVRVAIPLGCAEGTRLVLEIRNVDASGQPGSTTIFQRRFGEGRFPPIVTDEFQTMRIDRRVRFEAGDTFAIVLRTEIGSCGIWPGPPGDTYAGGTGWADSNDGPIVPLSLSGMDDLPFQTYVGVR